ncbi:NUDIX domain-containing protein [Streptomyces sp. NPDC008125]|uniref:NUDIX domain-containing protein n=1 Tax=Streptomyces sp. NPDC008125 TaxID=3364811 RepID=UPI0036EF673C
MTDFTSQTSREQWRHDRHEIRDEVSAPEPVLAPRGELDLDSLGPLTEQNDDAVAERGAVVLDAGGITFADSSFLRLVFATHDRADLRLANLSPTVQRLAGPTGAGSCLGFPSGRIACMTQGNLAAMSPAQGESLVVVAAAVVRDGRLLVVSKKAAPEIFYLPGGKPDADEEPLETLVREFEEELGVQPMEPRLLAEVESVAALEGVPMLMTVFEARLSGAPSPAAELAHMRWVSGREEDLRLAPAVRDHVLPLLRQKGLLAA